MEILIFNTDKFINNYSPESLKNVLEVKLWRPSFSSLIPPLLSKKYFFWWLFHYTGVFKNKDYAAVTLYSKKKVVGLIVLTPTYARWKFMKPNDLQLTNVYVDPSYRRLGIAQYMLSFAFENFKKQGRFFWYITTTDNIPSIKLCEKSGFQFAGKGLKRNFWGIKSFSEIRLAT